LGVFLNADLNVRLFLMIRRLQYFCQKY